MYGLCNAKTTRVILYSRIINEHIGQGSQLVYNVHPLKSDVPKTWCALCRAVISACSDTLVLAALVPSATSLPSLVMRLPKGASPLSMLIWDSSMHRFINGVSADILICSSLLLGYKCSTWLCDHGCQSVRPLYLDTDLCHRYCQLFSCQGYGG